MAAVSISVYKNTKADRSATLKDTTLCTEKHQPRLEYWTTRFGEHKSKSVVINFPWLWWLFLLRRFKPYLLPGDGHVVLDVSEHGGLDVVPSVCSHASSTQQLGSFSLSAADVAQNLVELLLIHLWDIERKQHILYFRFLYRNDAWNDLVKGFARSDITDCSFLSGLCMYKNVYVHIDIFFHDCFSLNVCLL